MKTDNGWLGVISIGIGVALAILFGRKKEGKSYPYSMKMWEPLLSYMAVESNVALPFVMEWMRIESGGNPCAWGSANAKGPDGHPREQGIAQLYNPDDFTRYGIPSGSFRVYCIPDTQKCSRELTSDEMHAQAKSLIDLIVRSRKVAQETASASGLQWSGKDRYRLTKLVHGLPGLVKQGIPRVTKKLGRPPKDWGDFKVTISNTRMDDGTERYRSLFPKLFANAEKATATLPNDIGIEEAVS